MKRTKTTLLAAGAALLLGPAGAAALGAPDPENPKVQILFSVPTSRLTREWESWFNPLSEAIQSLMRSPRFARSTGIVEEGVDKVEFSYTAPDWAFDDNVAVQERLNAIRKKYPEVNIRFQSSRSGLR